ncbi:MAG: Ig-like domain-containing protein [Dehalococcoidales bacterium]|nr:Ig-like domain-containing protein [Dehalococcoidales bacterium]
MKRILILFITIMIMLVLSTIARGQTDIPASVANYMYANSAESFTASRDAASAGGGSLASLDVGVRYSSETYYTRRSNLVFLNNLTDSATGIVLTLNGKTAPAGSDSLIVLLSTVIPDVNKIAYATWNQLDGYQSGEAMTGTRLNDYWSYTSYSDSLNTITFNAAGISAFNAAYGDSLKITIISKRDYDFVAPTGVNTIAFESTGDGLAPYLTVTMEEEPPPTGDYIYVLPDTTGTGSDNSGDSFANAIQGIPTTISRGDTIIVGGGGISKSYGTVTLEDALDGTSLITIRKATSAHSGVDGYQASYTDSVALFDAFIIGMGYYDIDGMAGGGAGSWDTGHGFKITGDTPGQKLVTFRATSGSWGEYQVTNVTLAHMEFEQRGLDTETADDCIYVFPPASASYYADDITIQYCYMHDTGRLFIATHETDGWLVEHNYFARNSSSPAQHAEAWADYGSDNMIVRYNLWEDIEGTAYIALMGQHDGDIMDSWKIYGNIFYYTEANTYERSGVSNGVVGNSNGDLATNLQFYNNTIVNVPGSNAGIWLTEGSNGYAYNNVWMNSSVIVISEYITHDYNFYYENWDYRDSTNTDTNLSGDELNGVLGMTDPFTDSESGDFTLPVTSPLIAAGVDSTWMAETDIVGATWGTPRSIGAYEYGDLGGLYVPLAIPALTTDSKSTTGFVLSVAIPDSAIGVKVTAADDTTVVLYQSVFPDSLIEITGQTPDTEQSWKAAYYNSVGNGAFSEAYTDTTDAQIVTTITISPSVVYTPFLVPTTFAAVVYDQDSGVMAAETVTWSASDGTIDGATGEYGSDDAGVITITATSDTDGGVTDTAEAHVIPIPGFAIGDSTSTSITFDLFDIYGEIDSIRVVNGADDSWITTVTSPFADPVWTGLTPETQYHAYIIVFANGENMGTSDDLYVATAEATATDTGTDPKSVGVVALTVTALLGTGFAAYRRYRGTYRP